MDDNIALLLLASCRTRHVRAKWFRRVPGLCVCLHKRQYANGRLLFQVLLPFSPVSGVLPCNGQAQRKKTEKKQQENREAPKGGLRGKGSSWEKRHT